MRLLLPLLMLLALPVAAMDIQVKGLLGSSAVVVVDGKQHLLKSGRTSPEGVKLIKVDSKQGALLEFDGKRQWLGLSRRIGTRYSPTQKAEVHLASGEGGHYFTPGRINNRPVQFLVDTGATSVAMNLEQAKALGLNYRAGRQISVSTANGVAEAYQVMLDSVMVGTVKVNNVEGTVIVGDSPTIILLGNSYLSRVDMRREGGLLVLKSRL